MAVLMRVRKFVLPLSTPFDDVLSMLVLRMFALLRLLSNANAEVDLSIPSLIGVLRPALSLKSEDAAVGGKASVLTLRPAPPEPRQAPAPTPPPPPAPAPGAGTGDGA